MGNALLTKWVPIQERGRASTLTTIGKPFQFWPRQKIMPLKSKLTAVRLFPGYYVGCIAGPSLAGVINTKMGWKYCFYINGLLALAITMLWLFCVTDTPQECKAISSDELQFISGNIESTNGDEMVPKIPPYYAMAKSMKVWAVVSNVTLPCVGKCEKSVSFPDCEYVL